MKRDENIPSDVSSTTGDRIQRIDLLRVGTQHLWVSSCGFLFCEKFGQGASWRSGPCGPQETEDFRNTLSSMLCSNDQSNERHVKAD